MKTTILSLIAIAGLVWAVSQPLSGLAWFPGFLVTLTAAFGIVKVNAKRGAYNV